MNGYISYGELTEETMKLIEEKLEGAKQYPHRAWQFCNDVWLMRRLWNLAGCMAAPEGQHLANVERMEVIINQILAIDKEYSAAPRVSEATAS